jgi:hypothetical protein
VSGTHRRTAPAPARHRRSPGLRAVGLRFAALVLLCGAFLLWAGCAYSAPVSVPGAAVEAACAASVTYLGVALLRRAARP